MACTPWKYWCVSFPNLLFFSVLRLFMTLTFSSKHEFWINNCSRQPSLLRIIASISQQQSSKFDYELLSAALVRLSALVYLCVCVRRLLQKWRRRPHFVLFAIMTSYHGNNACSSHTFTKPNTVLDWPSVHSCCDDWISAASKKPPHFHNGETALSRHESVVKLSDMWRPAALNALAAWFAQTTPWCRHGNAAGSANMQFHYLIISYFLLPGKHRKGNSNSRVIRFMRV